ncbi:MAG TPA: DUF3592 domain-containing protein [Pseudonocardiaceae bacterium]|nr:DUF3592 domain-containing protein [Pseudonocardiaceae bacterium]
MAILIGGCLGAIFILGFVRSVVPALRATRRGATAQGKIVAAKKERIRYRTIYRPIVRFETPDGQRIEYQDVMAVPGDFQVGENVTVHYDPSRPKLSATTSDTGRTLAMTIGIGALALFMTAIFVVGVLMVVRVLPAPQL